LFLRIGLMTLKPASGVVFERLIECKAASGADAGVVANFGCAGGAVDSERHWNTLAC